MDPSHMRPIESSSSEEPARSREREKSQRDGNGSTSNHIGERLRSVRDALRALRQGDLSVRLPMGDGDHIVKPAEMRQLLSVIGRHLRR